MLTFASKERTHFSFSCYSSRLDLIVENNVIKILTHTKRKILTTRCKKDSCSYGACRKNKHPGLDVFLSQAACSSSPDGSSISYLKESLILPLFSKVRTNTINASNSIDVNIIDIAIDTTQ